ncbi:MAG: hypothetical protein H0V30_08980 [Chitinophagaceae bacterium]|nr:hypothetical protein [Chitinophagaceae bacterium]
MVKANLLDRITDWEKWPFKILYFPISFVWAWYCIKARSVWFFSPSNPTLTFGGFEGESKREMYDQLPPGTFPLTIYISPDLPFEEIEIKLSENEFTYPFIVKPDVGMKGILFRKIDAREQLRKYHERMPVEYIIQSLIDLPIELSVFYYRHPAQEKGVISGMIQKELLEVTGDGKSTLWELILQHPRASRRLEEMKHRHEHRLDRVLEFGKHFYLSYAGNHNRGARFINLTTEIDDRLLTIFDKLSHFSKSFFYGRYDIKCSSLEALKQGHSYSIIEFNGCGAEPNHIYDNNQTLFQAYAEILKHWKILYQISKYNHKNGTTYWPFIKGYRFLNQARAHFKLLEKFD